MLRVIWRLSMWLSAALLLLMGGAVVVGLARPPHPAMASFIEGCAGKPAPCWYGIVPGITTAEEIMEFLEVKGGYRFTKGISAFAGQFKSVNIPFVCSFAVRVAHDVVEEVQVRYCQQDDVVFIGDVAGQLGVPPTVSSGRWRGLIYGDTAPRITPQGERWSPYDRTVSITLTADV